MFKLCNVLVCGLCHCIVNPAKVLKAKIKRVSANLKKMYNFFAKIIFLLIF